MVIHDCDVMESNAWIFFFVFFLFYLVAALYSHRWLAYAINVITPRALYSCAEALISSVYIE